jgi:hypothetical protein
LLFGKPLRLVGLRWTKPDVRRPLELPVLSCCPFSRTAYQNDLWEFPVYASFEDQRSARISSSAMAAVRKARVDKPGRYLLCPFLESPFSPSFTSVLFLEFAYQRKPISSLCPA